MKWILLILASLALFSIGVFIGYLLFPGPFPRIQNFSRLTKNSEDHQIVSPPPETPAPEITINNQLSVTVNTPDIKTTATVTIQNGNTNRGNAPAPSLTNTLSDRFITDEQATLGFSNNVLHLPDIATNTWLEIPLGNTNYTDLVATPKGATTFEIYPQGNIFEQILQADNTWGEEKLTNPSAEEHPHPGPLPKGIRFRNLPTSTNTTMVLMIFRLK